MTEAGFDAIAEATAQAFREIHDRVFRGDPAENPQLSVEVVGGGTAGDTIALVLLTPWTCNGLAFPPDGRFPTDVEVAGRPMTARPMTVAGLGRVFSVNLIGDVSRQPAQQTAVAVSRGWVQPWLAAVAAARAPAEAPTPAAAPAPVAAPAAAAARPAGLTRRGLFTLGRE